MANEESNKKESFCERWCRRLEISPDSIPHSSTIEIRGRGEMNVCGCRKILEYGPQEIRLELADYALSIKGEKLLCISYFSGSVGIEGNIYNISFEE